MEDRGSAVYKICSVTYCCHHHLDRILFKLKCSIALLKLKTSKVKKNSVSSCSRTPRFVCCCGKCSLAALFEHSCPLAYRSRTLDKLVRGTDVSFHSDINAYILLFVLERLSRDLKDSESSPNTLAPVGGRQPCLPPAEVQEANSLHQKPLQAAEFIAACDKLNNQCFHFRDQPSTSAKGKIYQILFSKNDERRQKSRRLPHIRKSHHSNYHSVAAFSALKSLQGCKTKKNSQTIANLVRNQLYLSGDIEINPGPPPPSGRSIWCVLMSS